MKSFLARTALTLAIAAIVALLVGLVLGGAIGWAVLALTLLVLTLKDAVRLENLRRWGSRSSLDSLPEDEGTWGEMLNLFERHRREQRRLVWRLARTVARARRAGRALPYGVTVLDQYDRIEWCNPAAAEHFGLDAARDRGQPIVNLAREPKFVAYMQAGAFETPLTLRSARARLILSVQVIPFGETHRLLLSRDVTESERVDAMRRDFVANVSHELRTPLTVVAGYVEMLEDRTIPEDQRDRIVAAMSQQSARMQKIIEDLLTLSKLESAPGPKAETVDIARLVARLKRDAAALSGDQRHRIDATADSTLGVLGDEIELASAFGNLVSNAVRYTPAGGQIRIRWERSGDGAAFVVEDTGIGIEADHIPRLTERFYRVDRSRSRATGGTGLGLSIVKHALTRHDAELDIESRTGKGSRFVARFPAARVVAMDAGRTGDRSAA